MSVATRIIDKLRNYEDGRGAYEDAINDIYALIQHAADLEEENDDLRDSLQEQKAWEGRYWALLEEAEASRSRKIQTCGEGLKVGTVVIDSCGDAWQVTKDRIWEVVGGARDRKLTLDPKWGPYTIIYTPNKKELIS